MKRVYLDNAATTPIDPAVLRAMQPYFSQHFGNPSSLHQEGQKAGAALIEARAQVARAISAAPEEVFFAASATEANNWAVCGALFLAPTQKSEAIVSAIEHVSVTKAVPPESLQKLPVNSAGVISLEKLKKLLNPNTALVSIIYASNEVGTIQPIKAIAKIIQEFRAKNQTPFPFFHVDAVQAFQYLDCNVDELGVDLMTLSSHKIYGPKGVGVLYVRKNKNWNLPPLLSGGDQEMGLRAGTENIPAIVGFSKAVELVLQKREAETKRVSALRDFALQELKKIFPRLRLNGPSGQSRLANNLNIYLKDYKAEDVLTFLDLQGIAISQGAACSSRATKSLGVVAQLFTKTGSIKPSPAAQEVDKNSLRITLGRQNTKSEINQLLVALKKLKKTF